MTEKWLFDFAFEANGDVEESSILTQNHLGELNALVVEEAEKMAEKLLDDKKEQFQLEVAKQINAANLAVKGAEISDSPYVSKTIIVNGRELHVNEFISDIPFRDPEYNGEKLYFSDQNWEWQKRQRNGGKKMVSNFFATVVLIVNPSGVGQCAAVAVCLRSVEKALIFAEGKITHASLKQQTPFCRRGAGTSDKDYYDSFVRAMMMCPNVFFLTIPRHSGGNFLHGGVYDYTSRSSVNPGLERLYPAEILNHQLLVTNRVLEDVIADYKENLQSNWKAKLCTAVRVTSILLPFYLAEGLKPDRCFVFTPSSENDKQAIIALTSRFSYDTPLLTSTTSRINILREAMSIGNDTISMLTYSACENNMRSFQNALGEIHRIVSGENGLEPSTRRIVGLITDIPGSIPEDYPAYYLSLTEEADGFNTQKLLQLSGELDYLLIRFLTNNPDAARRLVHEAVSGAKALMMYYSSTDRVQTMTMLIATSKLLQKIGLISGAELKAILNWFGNEAVSRTTLSEEISEKFKAIVSQAVISGALRVARQEGPPFYEKDGHTLFIANEDRSINIDDNALRKAILPQLPTVRNVAQLNRCVSEKGWMIATHSRKRALKVTFSTGISEQIDVFSYRRSILNGKAKALIDQVIDNEFWFDGGQLPEGFVPVLQNADGTKLAGYVLSDDMDINRHETYFGISRSGKSFGLLQAALLRAALGETVIIFDPSGSFTVKEVEKHVGHDLMSEYIGHWDVYRNGLPVNLIDLRGCQSKKEMKERITRLYAAMLRCLGSNEERILRTSAGKMLRDNGAAPTPDLSDIIQYIKNAKDAYGKPLRNDSHRNLLYKLEEILEDLEEAPVSRYNWGEFVKSQKKPIIVISTGLDSVGKSSELIDAMVEALYQYKQQFTEERITIVLDELQDLYLHEKGAINTMIRKIGKDGVSILSASQAFPEHTKRLGQDVGNCGRTRGYRPKSDDLLQAAKFFGCDVHEMNSLQSGECYDNGYFYSRHQGRNLIATIKGKTLPFRTIKGIIK